MTVSLTGFTQEQQDLIRESEDLMNESMAGMEGNLLAVEATYSEALSYILSKLAEFYNKYKNSPGHLQKYQIQQAIQLEHLAHRIQERLLALGYEYTDLLEGVLQDNFIKAVHKKADKKSFLLSDLTQMAVLTAIAKGYKGYNFKVDFQGKTLTFIMLVQRIIANGVINGKSYEEIAKELQKEMSKFIYHAKRIALTENARVINAAQMESYKKSGVSYVKWSNAPEEMRKGNLVVVCDNCLAIANGGEDGNGVYPIDNVPTYPAHPHCRCTLAPYTK